MSRWTCHAISSRRPQCDMLGMLPTIDHADVVVVDNASSDNSADVAAAHPHVRVICNPFVCSCGGGFQPQSTLATPGP
jgi:hypothetical protein